MEKKAEETASHELAKKLPSATDAIDTLTTAFTGNGLSKNQLSSAIHNIHTANKRIFEELDNRFNVESSYINGVNSIQLHPKEDIPFTIYLDTQKDIHIPIKMRNLFKHGNDVELNTESINVMGSDLLTYALDNANKMYIKATKIQAILKMNIIDDEKRVHSFDDIHGNINHGSDSFTFKGKACKGMFNVSYKMSYASKKSKCNFSIDYQRWCECSVSSLPYLDKLLLFYKSLANQWKIEIALEIEGNQMMTASFHKINNENEIIAEFNFLSYLTYARNILKYLSINNVKYTDSASYCLDDLSDLKDINNIIEGKKTFSKEEQSENTTVTMLVSDVDVYNARINSPDDLILKVVDNSIRNVEIFGRTIQLPNLEILFEHASLIANKTNVQINDNISIEIMPKDGYLCTFQFVSS